MRVIYSQKQTNEKKRGQRKKVSLNKEPLQRGNTQRDGDEQDSGMKLIQVQNTPAWEDFNLERAKIQIGPFLTFLKDKHDDKCPAFTSDLVDMIDQSDANQERAVDSLRSFNAIVSLTDLLALLGPAVEFALTLYTDESSRTPEKIEKFVISLVLSIAETTNKFGTEKMQPLEPDIIAGITVTVRNIMYAYKKDFSKIDYSGEITFFTALVRKFGCCCFKK